MSGFEGGQIERLRIKAPISTQPNVNDNLTNHGPVAKLVDALDLGSSAAMCESSSLSGPISKKGLLLSSFFIILNQLIQFNFNRFYAKIRKENFLDF